MEYPFDAANLQNNMSTNNINVDNSLRYGFGYCLLYTSPSPRDAHESRMPSSA